MEGSVVMDRSFAVIGETCDHGGCHAPRRIRAVFVFGELNLCRHHWAESEDLIAASATFLHHYDLDFEPIAITEGFAGVF